MHDYDVEFDPNYYEHDTKGFYTPQLIMPHRYQSTFVIKLKGFCRFSYATFV